MYNGRHPLFDLNVRPLGTFQLISIKSLEALSANLNCLLYMLHCEAARHRHRWLLFSAIKMGMKLTSTL